MTPLPSQPQSQSQDISVTLLSILKRSTRYTKCEPPKCTPATPKQTMIIAICFGVTLFLILLLVLWWYRCFCCYSRKKDNRSLTERFKDGFWGWSDGGVRPRVRPEGYEATEGESEEKVKPRPQNRKDWSWMLSFS